MTIEEAIQVFQSAIYGKDVRQGLVDVAEAVKTAIDNQLIQLDETLTQSGQGADAAVTAGKFFQSLASVIVDNTLDSVTAAGVYLFGASANYDDPTTSGRRLLFVNPQKNGAQVYQTIINATDGNIYFRCYHDHVWDSWVRNNDSEISAITSDLNSLKYSQGLATLSIVDLNLIRTTGCYRLSSNTNYDHQPAPSVRNDRRILFVSSSSATGALVYQILFETTAGLIYTRCYHDSAWENWAQYDPTDSILKKLMGMNAERKALDHGGFWESPYNTFEDSPKAFLNSANEGIFYHNIDIVFTSDNVPIVAHNDQWTDLTSGNTFKISEHTAAEVQTYTVGNSDYSFTLQTLAEFNDFCKKINGTLAMIDVSATSTVTTAKAQALVSYCRNHNIKPMWTNFDNETHRTAFINAGGDFGVYINVHPQLIASYYSITPATAITETDVKNYLDVLLDYIDSHTGTRFCVNVARLAAYPQVITAMEDGYIAEFVQRGVAIYTYGASVTSAMSCPSWAEGVVSDTININYYQYMQTVT